MYIFEVLKSLDPVHMVSIIPTGFAGGFTMPLPIEEKSYMTKTKMVEEIMGLCVITFHTVCRCFREIWWSISRNDPYHGKVM